MWCAPVEVGGQLLDPLQQVWKQQQQKAILTYKRALIKVF